MKASLKCNLAFVTFLLFLIIYPTQVFNGILSAIFPVVLFGKNAYVVFSFLALACWSCFLVLRGVIPRLRSLMFACVLIIIIFWSGFVGPIFLDSPSASFKYAFLLSFPCAWIFAHSIASYSSLRIKAFIGLIVVSLVTALIFHFNFILFNNLAIIDVGGGVARFDFETATTRAMLLNPSLHGSIVVMGMIAVLSGSRSRFSAFASTSFSFFLLAFMYSSLFYGQSRTPILLGSIVFFAFVCQCLLRSRRNFPVFLAIGFLVFVLYFFVFDYLYVYIDYIFNFLRRGSLFESGGRGLKSLLGILLLSDSFRNFLLGVPQALVGAAEIQGFQISDNSLIYVGIQFGAPISIIFYANCFRSARFGAIASMSGIILSALILLNLLLTNAILWQAFILGSIVLLEVLSYPTVNCLRLKRKRPYYLSGHRYFEISRRTLLN